MLDVKLENCAGIDMGKKFLAVCVLTGPADRKAGGDKMHRSGHGKHGARIGNPCSTFWKER